MNNAVISHDSLKVFKGLAMFIFKHHPAIHGINKCNFIMLKFKLIMLAQLKIQISESAHLPSSAFVSFVVPAGRIFI